MKLVAHINQSKLLYFHREDEVIQISENDHYLFMSFNNVLQSVMLKRVPYKLILPHHYFMLLPLIFASPANIVELGLGGGNLLRSLHHLLPNSKLSSIESNSNVVAYFHQFFNPNNIPLTIENIDAHEWLAERPFDRVEWFLCDIYHHFTPKVDSYELYLKMLNVVSPAAWLTFNLPDLTIKELEKILKVFSLSKQNRTMIYFSAPQYKNVVVHLPPTSGILPNHINSPLPNHIWNRWTSIWRHGIKTFI